MQPIYFTLTQNMEPVFINGTQAAAEATVVSASEKADKLNGLSAFSVQSDAIGNHDEMPIENMRFFFTVQEFAVYSMLQTAYKALAEGAPAAVYVREEANVQLPALAKREDCILLTMARRQKPLAFTDDLRQVYGSVCVAVFYQGDNTLRYLAWALRRFAYNYQKGFSVIADTLHTGMQGDREAQFAFEWPGYAAAFGVKNETIGQDIQIAPSVYEEEQCFADGTPLHPLLKPYFVRNYRLRIACQGRPFSHRRLFTDKTVVVGEDSGVPLTAMADCIWQNRPDLQAVFPAPTMADRIGYLQWFADNAAEEYSLDDAYCTPVQKALQNAGIGEPPQSKRLTNRLFSRSKPVQPIKQQYEEGVNLCAHIRGEYGIGEASRMVALTLQAAGEPFTIVDIASERDREYSNTQWLSKITNTFPHNINLLYTNADGVAPFLQGVSPDALRGRYNIGFWAWEMPEFPEEWVQAFAPFDEIWTLSQFSADAIASTSPVPVYSLPHPVVLDAPKPQYTREYFSLPEGCFVFLGMFDVRSVPERKNPTGMVQAFLEAFGDREDVMLLLKVNAPEGWTASGELARLVGRQKNIRLMTDFLTRDELNALLAASDAYISLHRSEGFGFGPAEAMFYGKPAVVTKWSGSMEYTMPDACCAVEYKLVELDKDYGPYKAGWHWAEPDMHDAANKMKRLLEDKEYRHFIAENGQRVIKNHFSAQSAAKSMRQRLGGISSQNKNNIE